MYKNNQVSNIDTYRTNTAGVLSSKVGFLRPGEQFSANDLGAVLQITSGEDAGRYVYKRLCAQVSSSAPPPTTRARIVLTESDGRQRYFDEVV